MRLLPLLLLVLVVAVSGCTDGNQAGPEEQTPEQTPVDQDNQTQDETRTDSYAGAVSNYSSASERLGYTDFAKVAAYPNSPGETGTHAAFTNVPPNHEGDSFEDFQVHYDDADIDASGVTQSDITNLVLDKGQNDTLQNPGEEDLVLQPGSIETLEEGRTVRIEPASTPDYSFTGDDRVITGYHGVVHPSEAGDITVEVELNTEETDRLYPDPARTTLQIRDE